MGCRGVRGGGYREIFENFPRNPGNFQKSCRNFRDHREIQHGLWSFACYVFFISFHDFHVQKSMILSLEWVQHIHMHYRVRKNPGKLSQIISLE